MKKKWIMGISLTVLSLVTVAFVAQYRSMQQTIHIEGEIFIPKPVAEVWTYLATDFDNIKDYSAGVKDSYYIHGHYQSVVGAQRQCDLVPEGFVIEEITLFDVDQRILKFKVTGGDIPLAMAEGTWELYSQDDGTRVVEKADFRMKYFFMNGLAKENFQQGIYQNLAGLKNLILNGQPATTSNIAVIMDTYGEQ